MFLPCSYKKKVNLLDNYETITIWDPTINNSSKSEKKMKKEEFQISEMSDSE